ncbi:diguanylate cyclase domain-containing protein [Marinicella sediminis]|uniref:Diguanylate cyclase domain-containing protein n=1 Tax=Marinicella sediminis TaxID=1792834 RepID=A0ABV7JA14_9GAMM|nr:GGDEF domain-containing protein [Marinicella sediminis]
MSITAADPADSGVNNPQTKRAAEQVFLKRVTLFYGNAGGNVAVAMITAVIASFIMIDAGVSILAIFIWLSLLVLFIALVLLVEVRFEAAVLTIDNANWWLKLRMISGGLVSLMYGLLVFFYPDQVLSHHVMYVVMLLIALVALCATGFAVMPVYTYLVSAVTMLPMLLFLMLNVSVFNLGLAFTMIVIWGVLINKARLVSITAIQALESNEKLTREIEDHKQTRKQLKHMVNHDHLTGLPNRKYLLDQLRERLQEKQQHGVSFALLYLDLDGFKNINDERGHAMGDWLLKAVAGRLRAALPEQHMLARMGGDEFIILVSMDTEDQHNMDLKPLIKAIRKPFEEPLPLPDGHPALIGISVGAVHASDLHRSARAIIQAADQAMYADKNRKRNELP